MTWLRISKRWNAPHFICCGVPLVLVSLSTTFQNQGSLLARLAAELQAMPVRAVITTGPIDYRLIIHSLDHKTRPPEEVC